MRATRAGESTGEGGKGDRGRTWVEGDAFAEYV